MSELRRGMLPIYDTVELEELSQFSCGPPLGFMQGSRETAHCNWDGPTITPGSGIETVGVNCCCECVKWRCVTVQRKKAQSSKWDDYSKRPSYSAVLDRRLFHDILSKEESSALGRS